MKSTSVIVPVFNADQYLCRCIDSILAQTFRDFEVILVDDGSTDRSGTICDEYAAKDSRINVIHKPNEGVAVARNTGLSAAHGEYIAFCDSDDAWEPELLEKAISVMGPEAADCVLFNADWIYPDGGINTTSFDPGTFDLSSADRRFSYFMSVFFQYHHGYEVWNRVFRAKIIREHDLRFCTTCNNYAEDMGFLAKFALYANKLVAIDDSLYHYYVVENSITRHSDKLRLNEHNESAKDFAIEAAKASFYQPDPKYDSCVYFMFMYPQLKLLFQRGNLNNIHSKLSEIEDLDYFQTSLNEVLKRKEEIIKYVRDPVLKNVFLLCRYCIHGNWNRYRVERKLAQIIQR